MLNELKRGMWRMTVHQLTAGQPRPYADHIDTYHVYFEWIPVFTNTPLEYVPVEWNEDVIKSRLRSVGNWIDSPNWYERTLTYIKKIDNGLWEFQVTTAFTD